jgi:hypothetical protein
MDRGSESRWRGCRTVFSPATSAKGNHKGSGSCHATVSDGDGSKDMTEYKGYLGKVECDDEAGIFHGEFIDSRDVITFQGGHRRGAEKRHSAIASRATLLSVRSAARSRRNRSPLSSSPASARGLNASVTEQSESGVQHLGTKWNTDSAPECDSPRRRTKRKGAPTPSRSPCHQKGANWGSIGTGQHAKDSAVSQQIRPGLQKK